MFNRSLLLSQGKVRRCITYQFKTTPPAELTIEQIEAAREQLSPAYYEAPATVKPKLNNQPIEGSTSVNYPNYKLSDGTYWYATGVEPTHVENATGDLVFNVVTTIGTDPINSNPCLDADCLITLSDGSLKKFRDLNKCDVLRVFNHDEGHWDAANLLQLSPIMTTDTCQLVTFESGKSVKSINNHRFLCRDTGRYERTTDLLNKDVVHEDGIERVRKIEKLKGQIEYRNAITYYHMNVVANGFLTSCGFNNLYPIKDMKFVKETRKVRERSEFNLPDRQYYGMRLSEQYSPVEEIIPYIKQRMDHNDC